ncbi:MAG: transglutaminase family protein [Pseudomonadota bacterium]
MRLKIAHTTRYSYDSPVPFVMQQVRLMPKNRTAQSVVNWTIAIEGGDEQLRFEDQHRNTVILVTFEPCRQETIFRCTGEVETENTGGVVGETRGHAPLWLFRRETALTRPGAALRRLAKSIEPEMSDPLSAMHALSNGIRELVSYEIGETTVGTTAEQALADGKGVCQDHVHVFLGAARLLGIPARYVSGYLMMNDRVEQDATHAWAEAHLDGLGWVGFDIANGICPDERYVCVATGLDYKEAAPVSGMRLGEGTESLYVSVQVQQ